MEKEKDEKRKKLTREVINKILEPIPLLSFFKYFDYMMKHISELDKFSSLEEGILELEKQFFEEQFSELEKKSILSKDTIDTMRKEFNLQ